VALPVPAVLLHVPPVVASDSVIVLPIQTVELPVIFAIGAAIVTTVVDVATHRFVSLIVSVYVPLADAVAPVITGEDSVLEKLNGPDQE